MSEKIGSIMYLLGSLTYTIILIKSFNIAIGLIIAIFSISVVSVAHKYLYRDTYLDYNDEKLIDIALKKVESSSNPEDKLRGLQQLYEKYTHDRSYYGLCGILKKEKDNVIKDLIVDYICKIYHKRKENKLVTSIVFKEDLK